MATRNVAEESAEGQRQSEQDARQAREVEFARFSRDEALIVAQIIIRAVPMFANAGQRRTASDLRMDLSAVHARCPLRLSELLEANNFNFAHDIFGITRHLNRETGDLDDHFRPRFAR